jgi:enediyne core biosynthesis thioesterase
VKARGIFVLRHTVTFEETNAVGNVYFVNYLRWQGRAREMFLLQHAPAVLEEARHGLHLVTVRCGCDFYVELEAFDEIEIRMALDRQEQNRLSLSFDFVRISRGSDELVARGSQDVAFLRSRAGGTDATRPPSQLIDALTRFGALAPT